VEGDARLGVVVVGDGQRDALERHEAELAVAQLGAEPRVRAERRGRAGQHAEEVRKLPARGERALEDG
jgi:soluble P-type ATPase